MQSKFSIVIFAFVIVLSVKRREKALALVMVSVQSFMLKKVEANPPLRGPERERVLPGAVLQSYCAEVNSSFKSSSVDRSINIIKLVVVMLVIKGER